MRLAKNSSSYPTLFMQNITFYPVTSNNFELITRCRIYRENNRLLSWTEKSHLARRRNSSSEPKAPKFIGLAFSSLDKPPRPARQTLSIHDTNPLFSIYPLSLKCKFYNIIKILMIFKGLVQDKTNDLQNLIELGPVLCKAIDMHCKTEITNYIRRSVTKSVTKVTASVDNLHR